jgi:hypothetical protein
MIQHLIILIPFHGTLRWTSLTRKDPVSFVVGLWSAGSIDLLFARCAIGLAMWMTGTDVRDPRPIEVLAGSLIVVAFIYLTLTVALTGRTWAMRLLSLRVIDTKTGLIPTVDNQ